MLGFFWIERLTTSKKVSIIITNTARQISYQSDGKSCVEDPLKGETR